MILDDDETVHKVWKEKLRGASAPKSSIFNFTEATKLFIQLHNFKEKTIFLLDHELRGQKETGIDVVKKIEPHLLKMCYIVSHNFQDPILQKECGRLNIGLFPKTLL